MSKTILIGMNNKFSVKANRWLFSLTVLLLLTNGALYLIYNYNNRLEPIGLILGILILFGGFYYGMIGLTAFSQNSKFALRVKIDNNNIELKNNFLKPVTRLNWTDLQSIEFGLYEISFQLTGTTKVFSYDSNADVSRDIKNTIREFAERKNVKIIGG